MGRDSHIEWTDHTFNPWIGCTKVSPGCKHCYAEGESKRRGWATWGQGKPRKRTSAHTWKAPLHWNEEARQRRKRQRVFCASLADVFDKEIDPQWRNDLWELIRQTPFLDWLLLTKRHQEVLKMLPPDWGDGWHNVCLMTSVEDRLRASRVGVLVDIPARYRALSVEPLLGPVKLKPEWLKKLDWVIVGGESGGNARPMHPEWVRSLRQQCEDSGVDFFFKQWGVWSPSEEFAAKGAKNAAYFKDASSGPVMLGDLSAADRKKLVEGNGDGTFLYRTTKHAAGGVLDGDRHRAHPFGRTIPAKEICPLLTSDERKDLQTSEKTIRKGLATFVEVGLALARIRNQRLYRATHGTFEEYVGSVLTLSRPQAYRLMDSAQVMVDLREMSPIGDISILPANEAQARELVPFKTPEERGAKWKEVVAAAKDLPPTAQFIHATLHPRHVDENATLTVSDRKKRIAACITRIRATLEGSGFEREAETALRKLEGLVR